MTAEQLEKLGPGGGGGGAQAQAAAASAPQAGPAFLTAPTPFLGVTSTTTATPSSSSSSSSSPSKARFVVACHGGHLLVQAALHPLVLALVARPDADVDALVDALPQLLRAFEPLRRRAEELTGGGGG
jgi:hypothetical protein